MKKIKKLQKSDYFPKEHVKQILDMLKPGVEKFLGGEKVVRISYTDKIDASMSGSPVAGAVGIDANTIQSWIKCSDGAYLYLNVKRKTCSFTDLEIDFLNEFFRATQVLISKTTPGTHKAHFKSSLVSSVFEITLARYLRDQDSKFWNIQQLLQYLKDLSFLRYEGSPCTVGFLFSNEIGQTLKHLEKLKANKRIKLKVWENNESVKVDHKFFDSILSYRYVDGIRSIYVIDNHLKVRGVIELPTNEVYTHIQITTHSPFVEALEHSSGNSFCLFVTKNSDVDILLESKNMIRWRKGKWTQVNHSIIQELISEHIVPSYSELLAQIIVALSSSGHGAIILIADPDEQDWDNFDEESVLSRKVDGESEIGNLLRRFRLKKDLNELMSSGILVSMLATDGMTVISKYGVVLQSSVLLKLGYDKDGSGGGRSAAAKVASHFGLAIKISEDGPIHIFKNGHPLIEIA